MKTILKLSALSMAMFCSISLAKAQYADEALLFSSTNLGGSARIQAMGGAQVSLGGDISSTLSNPAGLGFYNRSEISFTPTFNFQNSSSKADGLTTDVFKSNFGLNQLGVVINLGKDDIQPGLWRGGSLGISYSKTNNFNNRISYDRLEVADDFTDYVFFEINNPDNFIDHQEIENLDNPVGWAYQHYLVNPVIDGNGNQNYISITDQFPEQQISLDTKGHQSQWSFSYGGNYNDKIYLGGGIGVININYSSDLTVKETFLESANGPAFLNEISQNLTVQGSGINATFGLIVRPVHFLTIGVSAVSPTLYDMKSEFSESLITDYLNYYYEPVDEFLNYYKTESAIYISNYALKATGKLNAGATIFVGKHGFITGDVELVDYANSKLSAQDFSMNEDNQEITNRFKDVINYKVGGEYRFDIFRIRAGYAFYADPHQNTANLDRSKMMVSGGFGIKTKDYSVDLAVVNSSTDLSVKPYFSVVEGISNTTNTTALLTVGFTF